MKLGTIDEARLRELAQDLDLALDAEERRALPALMGAMLSSYARIEDEPGSALEAPPDRAWHVPDDNPCGAWYVKTSIRTRDDGPLGGRTVVLKDNVMLAGVPMLNGSALFEAYVAEVDASVATRLLDAGAEIVGKAHCENFCLSAGSHTCAAGPVRNPHDETRTSGGSSSGSAALVAAGEVDLAIGGDQGGSIRVPSSYCGTVGMKPTHGLVPYTGAAPIEPLIDHLGPITANVLDNARMLQAIAGPDGIDGRQSGVPAGDYVSGIDDGIEGLRVAIVREGFGEDPSCAAVNDCVREGAARLEKLGARVEEVSIPIHLDASALTMPILLEGMYRTVLRGDGMGSGRMDLYVESYGERVRRWREQPEALPLLVKIALLAGHLADRELGTSAYAKAVRWMRRIRALYDASLAEADCLLMPTTPTTAPRLPAPDASLEEQFAAAAGSVTNTSQFDVSHHPALSVPCGTIDGLPVGMMLVGKHHDESTLYRAAHAFERAFDWRE
jgi:amidase